MKIRRRILKAHGDLLTQVPGSLQFLSAQLKIIEKNFFFKRPKWGQILH